MLYSMLTRLQVKEYLANPDAFVVAKIAPAASTAAATETKAEEKAKEAEEESEEDMVGAVLYFARALLMVVGQGFGLFD